LRTSASNITYLVNGSRQSNPTLMEHKQAQLISKIAEDKEKAQVLYG
jgi:hypothetical protein